MKRGFTVGRGGPARPLRDLGTFLPEGSGPGLRGGGRGNSASKRTGPMTIAPRHETAGPSWQHSQTVTPWLRLIRAGEMRVYYRSTALIRRQAAMWTDQRRRLVLWLGTGGEAAEFRQLGLRFPAEPESPGRDGRAAEVIRGYMGRAADPHRAASTSTWACPAGPGAAAGCRS